MTKQEPLTLEDRGGTHRINLNDVNPYLAVAVLTAAILDEAGSEYPVIYGNRKHSASLLEHGRFMGHHLDNVLWGVHSLGQNTVLRAKWQVSAPLRKDAYGGNPLETRRLYHFDKGNGVKGSA